MAAAGRVETDLVRLAEFEPEVAEITATGTLTGVARPAGAGRARVAAISAVTTVAGQPG